MNTTIRLLHRIAQQMVFVCMTVLVSAPAARASMLDTAAPADVSRARALTCMTQAIAYEAGFEPLSGKQAVAEVILNRTRNSQFPASVCAVVYQNSSRGSGCQFTFTCDGALHRRLPDAVMAQAREIASAALTNQFPRRLNGALNYHADYVLPYWAATMVRVIKIGRHIFYRPQGTSPASSAYLPSTEPALPGSAADMAEAKPNGAAAQVAGLSAPAQPGFSLWGLMVAAAVPK